MRLLGLILGVMIIRVDLFSQAEIQANDSSLEVHAFALSDQVEKDNLYTGNLNADSIGVLPVGLLKEIGNVRYVICIDSMRLHSGMGKFSAYMALEVPQSDRRIAFAASGIGFNPKGVLPGSNSRLVMVSRCRIRFGPNITMVLEPGGKNYVNWDCNGFVGVNLNGYFEISNSLITPASGANDVVKAYFDIYVTDINDLLIQASITPFCVKGIKDISFAADHVVIDMSSSKNVPGMVFPKEYELNNKDFGGTWTGFYFNSIIVSLPSEFNSHGKRTSFYAANLLLDGSGVSGALGVKNVLDIKAGDMSSWNFSVDELNFHFTENRLNGGFIKGRVEVPAFSNYPLKYGAAMYQMPDNDELDYSFMIGVAKDVKAEVFSASINIDSSSYIEVKKQDGRFEPKLVLTGDIKFMHSNVSTASLNFQDLTFETTAPYLTKGIIGYASNEKFKAVGFPLSINKAGISIGTLESEIFLEGGINLSELSSQGFSSNLKIGVQFSVYQYTDASGRKVTEWKHKRIKFYDIALNASTTAFALKGQISFRDNDPLYGKGFFGSVEATFNSVLDKTMKMNSCFGTKDDIRYWYVDIYAPVDIRAGYVQITKIMGGASSRMKNPIVPGKMTDMLGAGSKSFVYLPDKNTGLNFRAGVAFAPAVPKSDKLVNGDAELEVSFNSEENGGGIQSVNFTGNIYLLCSLTDRVASTTDKNKLYGTIKASYDANNKVFHTTAVLNINYPVLKGQGTGEIHIDPKIWYVYAGKPSNPIEMSMSGMARFKAYFMTGNKLEPLPPLPSNVSQLAADFASGRQFDAAALSLGRGMAMGASLNNKAKGKAGGEKFNFYYDLFIDAGFDLMLLQYDKEIACGSYGPPVGMNGWRANGNLYAAVSGLIGAELDTKKSELKQDIMTIAVVALLSGECPNPSYMSGYVNIKYEVFGMFDGQEDVSFEFGNKCYVKKAAL